MQLTKQSFYNNLRNNKWWHIALLVILPAIIYVQCIKFDYTNFDDNGIIRDKFEIVGNIKDIDTLLHVDAFFNPTGDFYRPVQNLSFMLDAQATRNKDKLWMFHITNIIIHILTCLALYFFLQLFQLKRYTAFLLSILFAVHPLFASGVGWVPSRGDILIGLLGLLLFITFDKYFKGKKILWFALHSLVFLVIIFTKETTILFPLLLLYYYFLLIHQPADFNFKKDAVKLFPFFIVWGAVCISYLILRSPVTKNTGATSDVLGIIPFFKNLQVVPTIIGKFFVPYRLSTFPLYEDVSTIIGLVFLLGILYLTFEYTKHRKWAVLLGFLWFALFTVVPTIYRLPNADIFFNYLEHRTYLPMLGLVLIIGFFLEDELANISFAKYFNWFYTPLIILFGILAYIHCADYADSSALRNRAAGLDNPSALAGQAGELLDKKDTIGALNDVNRAIEKDPSNAGMYFERGKIMSRMQQHDIAEQNFSLALQLEPNYADALMARSIERRFLKKYQGAYRDIFQAEMLDSANPRIYNSFGNLYLATGDYKNAVDAFTIAVTKQPYYAEAYNNRAYAKILSGNAKGAITDCHIALTMIPRNYIVYNNMAHAYRALNQLDSALFYVNRGIAISDSLQQPFPDGYFERGMEKHTGNDADGACKDWDKALTLGYTDTSGIINKYCKGSYYK